MDSEKALFEHMDFEQLVFDLKNLPPKAQKSIFGRKKATFRNLKNSNLVSKPIESDAARRELQSGTDLIEHGATGADF